LPVEEKYWKKIYRNCQKMKIKFIVIGKTDQEYLKEGIREYESRIRHYLPFETIVITSMRKTAGLTTTEIKIREAELLLKNIVPSDYVVLLDEIGKEMNSVGFSVFLRKQFSSGMKALVFLVGGPYGVDEVIKKRANQILALSQMTFSHQMVRLFFLEQLYRGLTILNNEPYHHE
jgi:23S rRNA (pseudouridine1915-N3)-methyltransferase